MAMRIRRESLLPLDDLECGRSSFGLPDFFWVLGLDEVGRGCLAGPVVAGCFAYSSRAPWKTHHPAACIVDSKLLKAEERREAVQYLSVLPQSFLATAQANVAEINRLNILHASMLAMERALKRVRMRIRALGGEAAAAPCFVRVDGNRLPPQVEALRAPHVCQALVKGDTLSFAVAAAAIAAKEHRDALMIRLAQQHPAYSWADNVGYPTPAHKAALRKHGYTVWHRAYAQEGLLAAGSKAEAAVEILSSDVKIAVNLWVPKP